MRKLWILVANSSFAQIYEVQGPAKNIHQVHSIDNPDGRKKGSEVYSDRPTRNFQSIGPARNAVVNEFDYHTHVMDVFAHKICELLKKGEDDHSFNELAIIAPSEFIGMLNTVMHPQLRKAVSTEVKKDLPLTINEHERVNAIVKYLDLP